MKKKEYLKPSASVMEMDGVEILAGSGIPIKSDTEDGPGLEYGGDTKPDQEYSPW